MFNFTGRKPSRFIRHFLAIAFVFSGAHVSITDSAQAQSPAEGNSALLQRIQLLEEKVHRLESLLEKAIKTVDEKQSTTPPSNIRAQTAEPKEDPLSGYSPNDFRVYWKDAIRFDSRDEKFKLQIGGRIQNDWAFFSQDRELKSGFSNEQDGTKFRRARIRIAGSLYDDYSFMVQYDFAGGDADLKNGWIAANNIPLLGQIKVGQFKEPIGLEVLGNANNTTFMEFALPSVFSPLHRTGVGISNTGFDKRVTWAAGVFRGTDSYGNRSSDGEYNLTGRMTGLPWYQEDGRKLLHLGLAYSHRTFNDVVRIRQRPESNLAQNFYLDTGEFDAHDADLLGLEAAWVHGPLSIQSEYTRASYDTVDYGNEELDGYYGQISYFLTGEHRPYKQSNGTFARIRPRHNYRLGPEEGIGAWELALRYSSLDLNGQQLQGGQEDNTTFGINWYLNPALRVSLNYVHSEIDSRGTDGSQDAIQTRFQAQF